MEYNPNLLPPKKRPFVLAFFQHQPLTVCNPIQPQTSYEEDQVNRKTEEHCAKIDGTQFNFIPELLPPQPRIRKTLETLFREEFEFGNGGGGSNCESDYRPAKRMRCSENREEVEKLHALYNYIMEPESEMEICQIREKKLEEQKKKMMMRKKRKGAWSKTVSSLSRGWKNLRREKVVQFGKENAKALFGKFWTGNESFKWDIQHYSDPLSLPNFRSFRL